MLLDVAKGAENIQHFGFNMQTLDPIAADIHWGGDIWSVVSGRVRSLSPALIGNELEPMLQMFGDSLRVNRLCIDLHHESTHWNESKSGRLAKLFNLASASLPSFDLTMDSSPYSSAFRVVFHNLGVPFV